MGNTRTVVTGANIDIEKKTIYNQPGEAPMSDRIEGRRRPTATGIDTSYSPSYYEDRQESVRKKPLVGFLVSVSRTTEGEFWPLRLGENIIGSANECSIRLNEAKVSEKHAALIIQINEEENLQLNVWINGLNATNGTYLNKKLITPQTVTPCNNEDKIKIGSYELLVLLFDANRHGLQRVEGFTPKYENNTGGGSYGNAIYGGTERFSSETKTTRY